MSLRQITLGVGLLLGILAGVDAGRTQAQTVLRYKFKEGEKLNYEIKNESKSTITFDDKGPSAHIVKMHFDLSWRIKKVSSDGKAAIAVRLDRLRCFMDTPAGTKDSEGKPVDGKVEYDTKGLKKFEGPGGKAMQPTLDALASLEFDMTMDALGRISDLKVPKELVAEAAFPLPNEPLTKGKTWRLVKPTESSPTPSDWK
jgi:hypothetical protein